MSTIMLIAFCDADNYDEFDGFSEKDDYILTQGESVEQAEEKARAFMGSRYYEYRYETVCEDVSPHLEDCKRIFAEDYEKSYGFWNEWLGDSFSLLEKGADICELDWESAKLLMQLLDS